jgi:CRP/FNR family transcriptional regulator, cyclic AMP receptor protein
MPANDVPHDRLMQVLAGLPLFSSVDEGHLRSLSRDMRTEHLDAGTVVLREGQSAAFGDVGIVLRGSLEVRRDDVGHLGVIGPGEFFGEMAALDGGVRSATLVATEGTDVALLKEWNLRSVLHENPELAVQLLIAMSERLREARRETRVPDGE